MGRIWSNLLRALSPVSQNSNWTKMTTLGLESCGETALADSLEWASYRSFCMPHVCVPVCPCVCVHPSMCVRPSMCVCVWGGGGEVYPGALSVHMQNGQYGWI